VPLVSLRLVHRRGAAVRRSIRLPEPRRRVIGAALAALGGAALLLGLAAAQPRIEWTSDQRVRSDAEAFVVLDTSRSMLARQGVRGDSRFARAREAALRFRTAFPEVPVGIASFTDRVLPHLFPSADDDVFVATLRRSLAVDRPPPRTSYSTLATNLSALETVVSRRFFTPTVRRRVIFVITDGESTPVSAARIGALFRRPPGVDTIFLHVWNEDERVFDGNEPEPQYSPDPRSRGILDATAETLRGRVFAESELDQAITAARNLIREGPTVERGRKRNRIGLAPYLAGAVFFPLALLLWRRDR